MATQPFQPSHQKVQVKKDRSTYLSPSFHCQVMIMMKTVWMSVAMESHP